MCYQSTQNKYKSLFFDHRQSIKPKINILYSGLFMFAVQCLKIILRKSYYLCNALSAYPELIEFEMHGIVI